MNLKKIKINWFKIKEVSVGSINLNRYYITQF